MNVLSLHHTRFAVTDLAKTEQFAKDFGLATVLNESGTLYMQTANGEPYSYIAEQSSSRGLLEIGFLVATLDDLNEAIALHDASPLRKLTSPGGGMAVTLQGPEGLNIMLLTAVEASGEKTYPDALEINTPMASHRHAVRQTQRPLEPPSLFGLGHLALLVQDLTTAQQWFEQILGLVVSDTLHAPDNPDQTIVTFMRTNKNDEWVDHHCIFLGQSTQTDCHHISFEVADFEAQFRAHRWMNDRGWKLCWGVGRHPQGSHVFDMWYSPDGYRFETYSDTDKLNNTHKPGNYDVAQTDLDEWSSEPPDKYFS